MQGERNYGGQSAKGPSISFTSLSNYRLGFEVEIYACFCLLLVWSVLKVLVHLIESQIQSEMHKLWFKTKSCYLPKSDKSFDRSHLNFLFPQERKKENC